MKLPNLFRYKNFDDFIQKNDVEVMSFADGVAARYKTFRSYKNGVYRVTETKVNQVIGRDYQDLSKKLKKKLRWVHRIYLFYILGIAFGVLIVLNVKTELNIVGIVFAGICGIFFLINLIETFWAQIIFASKSIITKDYTKVSYISLFHDVFAEIAKEEEKIYRGDV